MGTIRDLQYPEDARKELISLCNGLAYDDAVAVAGVALSKIPLTQATPDFAVPIRCGGLEQDQAVRREAPILFSRFSLISMISRFEIHLQNLLRQRRVLEHLKGTIKRMDSRNFWRILTLVQKESRLGPVGMGDGLVVAKPSAALKEKMEWLDGLYRVRNCLAHRLGTVRMIDVKPPGVPLDQTKDNDTLKAVWLRPRVLVDGKEIQLPYTTEANQGTVDFETYVREWKIGAQIDVNPLDCQGIALSLSMLGQQLQMDFEGEMNALLGIPAHTRTASGK
ncbi:MAG: hypothetical protein ABI286_04600 [Edaphobacter sp.]